MREEGVIDVDDATNLAEFFQVMVELLVSAKNAYGVVDLAGPDFVQIMALEDGSLRLESSASEKIFAADLGFSETVTDHEHIAATHLPADWEAIEEIAAKTMTLVAIEVHGLQFPASLEFELDLVDR